MQPSARRSAKFWLAASAASAVALALCACAQIPHLEPNAQIKPPAAYQTQRSFSAASAAWPTDRWWTAYGDPQLDALIDEGLAGAPSLAQARARVRAALAQAEQADAALQPHVAALASVAEGKESYQLGVDPAFLPHGGRGLGLAGAGLDWELDFFGKHRSLFRAASLHAQAVEAQDAAARLSIASAIATAYADLARLFAERDAAQDAARLRQESERLIGARVEHNLEAAAALDRARSERASAQAELIAVDEAIGRQRNVIAALMGEGPDRGLSIARPQPLLAHDLSLPADLPAQLIGRRPDVVVARLEAEASAARVRAARAAFYPNVDLMALGGVQSVGLDMLTRSGAGFGQVGPAVTLPILSGGQLQGAYRGAHAEEDEAVAAYDEALTQALREVADSAVSLRALQARLARSREALIQAQNAYDLIRARYAQGLGTYLEVLLAEDALVARRGAVAQLETQALSLDIALVRSLGGGFRT